MKLIYAALIFLYNVIGINCFTFFGASQGARHAAFERFDNICGGRQAPIIFNYSGLRNDGNKVWMNSTITVKEKILTHPKMLIIIDRCKSKENLDSCEQFYVYKVDNYCSMLEAHSPIWEPFYTTFAPKWECPFKKGVYRGTNSMLDASAFLLFPVDNWVWNVKIEVRNPDTERMLMCLFVQAHIILEKS